MDNRLPSKWLGGRKILGFKDTTKTATPRRKPGAEKEGKT